jgi:hypothetical protein
MTTAENAATDKAAAVAAQGAHVAPEKAPAKKAASQKKGAPKAKKTAKGAKQDAKAKAAAPRAESKGAKILEMIGRAKCATLAEIMKATVAGAQRPGLHLDGWQEARRRDRVGQGRCRRAHLQDCEVAATIRQAAGFAAGGFFRLIPHPLIRRQGSRQSTWIPLIAQADARSVNAARLIVTYLAANRRCRRCSWSLAAGTAPILVRRTSKAGTGRAEYIEQREGIYRLSRRSGLQIHLLPSHPVRLVGSGDGLADLYEPLA